MEKLTYTHNDAAAKALAAFYETPPLAYVRSYGCQQNVNDGEKIKGVLQDVGYGLCDNVEHADLILFNTCAVREHAEQRVFGNVGALKKLKEQNPRLMIGVCGCMAQQEHIVEKLRQSYPYVDLVFGVDGIDRLPAMLAERIRKGKRYLEKPAERNAVVEELPIRRDSGFRAWLPIMYGCDNFCTYCIVPFTRGRQKSRDAGAILDECRALIDNGAKEITLLGQNVNSYGLDKHASGDTSFARLLRKVSELPGLARLRFVTPHPKDLSPEVIAMFGEVPNLCPRLHLPLQAGSDRVLARMNRKYDMARYMTLVEGLRAARPDIALSTDLIVGFPGETEEQFQETLDAVRAVNFMSSFSFCYSDRPGTAASRHTDKVEPAEKLRRLERLQALQEDLSSDWLKARVGCKTDILLEGASRKQDGEDAATESWQGRDPWGDAVNVSLPAGVGKPGLIVPVIIVTAKKHSLIGELRG